MLEKLNAIFGFLIHIFAEHITFIYQGVAKELPIWLVVILLIIICFILHKIFAFMQAILNLYPRFKLWLQKKKIQQANNHTALAISALAEGNIVNAAKYALLGKENSSIPLINYLALASAANAAKDNALRDQYLFEASLKFKQHQTAILLTKAKMQLEQGDFSGCIASLNNQRRALNNHPRALELLSICYQHKITNLDLTKTNYQELINLWQEIPKSLKINVNLVLHYAEQLNKLGHSIEAEKVVREQLKREFNLDLIKLYGKIEVANNTQIKTISAWLEKFPNNPEVLLAAAQICIKNKLWGKARSYLEQSLALNPKPETFAVLGNLLETLGENEQSKACFQKGLQMRIT